MGGKVKFPESAFFKITNTGSANAFLNPCMISGYIGLSCRDSCDFHFDVTINKKNLVFGMRALWVEALINLPNLTPAFGGCLAEAASVCLDSQGHPNDVSLKLQGHFKEEVELHWNSPTGEARNVWNDDEKATEHGAYAVALLLIREFTEMTYLKTAKKGKGFDFWLTPTDGKSNLPFQNAARLEVSGIRVGSDSDLKKRLKMKLDQIERAGSSLVRWVVIVEFSEPISEIARK